ncbi:beta-propeller fold lactonase family protein [uncultured Solobacterium sp.]|uniref:beta-propeller fold lactonase family protein n=1 Tax=uncultured Solobacterium sp. TaxID=747375 RepID=UPI0028DB2D95|nr:beta-propeller fold lactonase family protein [uncultured Solobacterium sp.]
MMAYTGYVGTYTSEKSEGIYAFTYKNQKITDVHLFTKVRNPKYLAWMNDYIVAVCDFEEGSGVAVFDLSGNEIDHIVFEAFTSCYVGVKDNLIFTAHFHSGDVTLLRFENNHLELVQRTHIKDKAGCHQVIPYKDQYLVPCLFMDQITILNQDFNVVDEISFEEGAGPRHAVFSDDEKYLYVVGELSNLLYVVDMHTKKIVNTVELLENGLSHVKDTAAIRKKGDYLYVSTRTQDVITVLHVSGKDVKRIQVTSCAGKHPRDFVIVDDDIIVANRFSDSLSVLPIENAYIQGAVSTVTIPEGVSIIMRRNKNE